MSENTKPTATLDDLTGGDVPIFVPKKQSKIKKIIKRIILTVIALLVLAAIAFGVYKVFAPAKKQLSTATVTRGSITSTVTGSGSISPSKTQDVVGLAKGAVSSVFVKVGDNVAVGAPLFEVDDKTIRDQLTAALGDLRDAQESIAKVQAKKAALNVVAPIKGKVLEVKVKVGDSVTESTPIGQLVDDSKMRLTLYFSTAYINQIAVGQKAEVSIPQSMAQVKGTVDKVEKVNRITPEGTILFEVQIVMANPGALAKDMSATAFVITPKGKAAPAESGVLDYYDDEVIFPKASGTIISIDMKNYYSYNAGDTLVTLENTNYDDDIDTMSTTVETAQKSVDQLNDQLDYYYPKSKISGTVLAVNIAKGDTLDGTSNVVLSIADVSKMVIDAQIDELDVGKLVTGMAAMIDINTEKGTSNYSGTLTSIAMQGKSENGYSYFPAKIEFSGSADLRSGMWVNYTLTSASKDNVLLLPFDAVKYTDAGSVVLVKDTGTKPQNAVDLPNVTIPKGYIAVSVVVGNGDGTNLEIVSGVDEGTEVAISELKPNNNGGGMMSGGSVTMSKG